MRRICSFIPAATLNDKLGKSLAGEVSLDTERPPGRHSRHAPTGQPTDELSVGRPIGVGRRLYEITVPALSIETDLPAVRHRLLAEFPRVVEVLAMNTPRTVMVVYDGEDEVDAWCRAISDAVATGRRSHGPRTPAPISRSSLVPALGVSGRGR